MSSTIQVWYFKAGEDKVKLINLPINPETKRVSVASLKEHIGCEYLDGHTWHLADGEYTVWWNDNGLYEDTEYNKTATQVIRKLALNWGSPFLTGNYIVAHYREAEGFEEPISFDIPKMSFKDFITQANEKMKKKVNELKQWVKENNAVVIDMANP